MTALRQQMIEAMRQRGFAQRTHTTYLMVITDLACYFHRSPDTLSTDHLQHFFYHLVQERGLSAASCRVYLHGVRFFLPAGAALAVGGGIAGGTEGTAADS